MYWEFFGNFWDFSSDISIFSGYFSDFSSDILEFFNESAKNPKKNNCVGFKNCVDFKEPEVPGPFEIFREFSVIFLCDFFL